MSSPYLHIVGFKPPDEKWRQMKAIYDACTAAKVDPPPVVEKFFYGYAPDAQGVLVEEKKLKECGALSKWSGNMSDGYEIDVKKLPPDVTVIRVYNSY